MFSMAKPLPIVKKLFQRIAPYLEIVNYAAHHNKHCNHLRDIIHLSYRFFSEVYCVYYTTVLGSQSLKPPIKACLS